jgi:hypothetical protein
VLPTYIANQLSAGWNRIALNLVDGSNVIGLYGTYSGSGWVPAQVFIDEIYIVAK